MKVRILKLFFVCFLLSFLSMEVTAQNISNPVFYSIPVGFNSWVDKNPKATDRMMREKGIVNWGNSADKISTYFRLEKTGKLNISIVAKVQSGVSKIKCQFGKQSKDLKLSNSEFDTISVGTFTVKNPGYQTLEMQGVQKTGECFAEVRAILISGDAVQGAVNYVKEDFHFGRRGPSVHFAYQPGKEANDIMYFYNEVTVPKGWDIPGTYCMANGFNVGYFGMQVNSETERRILFSVWSPFETDHPGEIPESDRIKLMKKGKDVNAQSFGGEGSGGQSFRRYNWITGNTYKFLLKAEPLADNTTTFTAWFFAPETGKWELVASFNRPKTNTYLKGLHSFLENFNPNTGDQTRKGEYANQWVCDKNGKWFEVTQGMFTADATAHKQARLDYCGGVEKDNFFLKNCGFFDDMVKYNQTFSRKPTGRMPQIDFTKLP